MKKITTFFALLISAIALMASPVEPEQAQTIALNFMVQKSPTVTRSTECTLAYTWSNDRSSALFYVYNVGGGFVIVSADDAVMPVLGYSTSGSFTGENIPVNCREWLQGYADEIAFVKENNLDAPEKVHQAWMELAEGREPSRSGNSRAVEPLLTTTWNQSPYYNSLCPGIGDEQAVTGCVATAMAQIINYHQYPLHGYGSHSYDHSTYGEIASDFSNSTYQFDLMPDYLNWSSSTAQVNAVATLMRDCGIAANMNYGVYESGASDYAARAAFINHFGYDAQIAIKSYRYSTGYGWPNQYATAIVYSDSVWMEMLKAELDAQMPVFYSGTGTFSGQNGTGHAFVCDGYDANNFFHFNWGWGGSYDGYFKVDSIKTDDYYVSSGIVGDQPSSGFWIDRDHTVVFAHPNENAHTLLFNYGGTTSRTISQPTLISPANGLNDYSCVSYTNSYTNTLTLYPGNEGDQLKLDVLAFSFDLDVYDGEDTDGTLLASNPAAGTTLISTTGALTLYFSGSLRCYDTRLQVEPVSCVPIIENMECIHKELESATLTWDVMQSASFENYSFNWQVEYGPQGFTPGTGSIIYPDSSTVIISGLEANTPYDAYLTYDCVNGTTVTLDPLTFQTAYMSDCHEPFGTGTMRKGFIYSTYTREHYCVLQQIFTAEDLASAGLTTGDIPSTIWLQYPSPIPTTRLMGVYMGQTDKSAFESSTDWFDFENLSIVYPPTNTHLSNTNSDYWIPFHFDNTIAWDGLSNLVIAFTISMNLETIGELYNLDYYEFPFYGQARNANNCLYWASTSQFSADYSGELSNYLTNIRFCAATSCIAPANLTASTVSRTEVRLNWDRMYRENEWTVEYGLSGFEQGHGTSVTVTGEPATVIANLEHGTYDFYVRSECGGSNHSDWRMVSANVMGGDDCVEILGNDLSSGELVATSSRYYSYSRSQQIFLAEDLQAAGVQPGEPMYALSVQYNSTEPLTRKMAVYMANTDKSAFANNSDWFDFGVLTNVFPEADFTFEGRSSEETYRWVTFNFEIPFVWDGTSNVVVAFDDNTGTLGSTSYSSGSRFYQHTGHTNNTLYWLSDRLPESESYGSLSSNLSNIRFCEGCMYPINITYETPSRHEVVFTWQPGHEETQWHIEYGPAGFEQGTGTIVSVSGEPTLTVSQLGRGAWDFYFQSDCGNGSNSLWQKVTVTMGTSEEDTECFQIGNGTATDIRIPIGHGSSYDETYTYTQQLYTSDEIAASGLSAGSFISALSFQYSGTSKSKDPVTIWLGSTTRTGMSSGDGFIPTDEMQQVFTGEVSLSDGWVSIRLDQPYTWDGNNLVVAVLNNSGTDDRNTLFLGQSMSSDYTLYKTSYNSINPNNSNPYTTRFRSNIRFCANDGCTLQRTIDAIVNEGDSYDFYGRTINEQGTYFQRFYVDEDCDSLITLNLTVRKIIYVTPTGARTHSGASWQHAMELQEAMDTAATYTNVTPFLYVKKGNYAGNTSAANSYEIKANVRAYGGFNGDEGPDFNLDDRVSTNISFLSGGNARRVLYQSADFTESTATLLDGFTLQGGTVDNAGEGGAAYIRKYCTLRNCKITGNNASISGETSNITRSGVAVYNNGGTLENCEIYNNNITLSGTGSGHNVWGVGVFCKEGTLTNCTIRNNTTVYDGSGNNWHVYGGGIYMENNSALTHSSITLNSASEGGGVAVRNTSNSSQITVNDCVISNNTARGDGGGVYVYYNTNGSYRFAQCLIGNNVSGNTGGGIYDGGAATYTACNVVRNSAATNGGGIYSHKGTTFLNSVIWGNKVGNSANHIAIYNGKYFTFVNSAYPGTYSGALTLQEENSGTGMGYPMFANPTAEAGADANNAIGDWSLQQGSFLIGLGNNSLANTETDLAGNARIQQERVDIGAYESAYDMAFPLHPEAGSNIIYVTTTGAGTQDGSSWSNATANLQYAMDIATGSTPPATVWMAKGTYTCEQPYIVHPNVAVYGSFVGNEPYNYDLTQRDFENNATILDGDRLYRVLDKTCPFSASSTTTYYSEPVEINMPVTGSMDITACSGTIYDDGGPSGNFSQNCNGEIIIRSYNPHGTIRISVNYDNSYYGRLKIYDGVGGMELGNYNYDGNTTLTTTSGVAVIQFTTGSNTPYPGFTLRFTCSDCTPEVPETLVSFRNGESLFDGITVQNGYDRNASFGGGYLLAHTDLLNCTFTNNLGSGVHVEESTVENCTFTNNGAKGFDGTKLTIRNCRSAHNSTYGISGSGLTISNCTVEDNSSHGIYFTGSCNVDNSIIRNNNSYGIYMYSGSGKVNGCTISGNRNYGIYNGSSATQVFNTSIVNNNGIGIYAYGGLYVNVNVANNTGIGVNANNGAQFTNCHIVRNLYNNNSSTTGAGVSNGSNGTNQFTNCVIWGNKTKNNRVNISGSNATYAYCAVEGGVEGTSNITLDTLNSGDEAGVFYPNFVNPADTAGKVSGTGYDYSLSAGSACINQGIANTTSLNLPLYDLAGSLRIKQNRIDIGAYEYGGVIANTIHDSICIGDYIIVCDNPLTTVTPSETGLYTDSLIYLNNNDGLDYITHISLKVNEVYDIVIDTSICEGESYFFDGEYLTESGTFYTEDLHSVNGCDSAVTLILTVLPHSTYAFSATRCDSYTWNDTTYYESGVYQQVFEAANGCDSTVTLTLTITESTEYEFDQLACVVYNWNGVTYRQSGDYTQHFRNAAGCDSTVTMHLTVLDVLRTEFDTTVCDAFVWNDETYTTSGDKVQYFTSANDCDSIVTVHLTVNRSVERMQRLTRCDSYTWNDTTYFESGTYQQFFTATNGCDSTVTLHLTINHSTRFEFDTTACDLFVWNDSIYDESGDYQQILTNTADCDSTVTLHLTIRHSNEYEFDDEACGVYVWNDSSYYESGDYQQVLTNAAGCDSTVTVHLTLYPEYNIPDAVTICRSQLPYTYVNGQINHTFDVGTPDQTTVSFPLSSMHGCDSILTLTLTVNPIYDITLEEAICQNELPYHYVNGEIDAVFGLETPAQSSIPFHLTSATGCDSLVTLQLTVHPSYNTPLTATVCENELPFHYVNGQIDTTFLQGTPATQNEFTFHLSTIHGCDSAVTLTLTVIPATTPQLVVDGQITACQSSTATLSVEGSYVTYDWSTGATTPTIEVSTPGYYWVSLTDAYGCTSMTEVTQLGVSTLIPETPAICMVGVENGHNLVVWEELENTNVQYYRIYRENDQANVYELLATVPAAQGNAYEDVTADPTVRAWRYKVTAMDVCQSETPMSELHKTVHLTINRGINDNWNLIWTHYEGMDFPSYRLYRGTANNNLELIATLPSTLTSYTDFDNVDGALFYQIEVVMNGSCLRHTRDVTYTGSRSNIVYNGEVVYTDTAVTACEEYDWNGTVYTQSGVYQQDYTSSLGYDVHAMLHLTIVHYPGFSISGSTTIVSGGSTTLSVTPTNPQWGYLWSTGATTSSITVSPTETTTYYVTVTNGPCEISSWKTVNVTTGVNEWGDGIVSLYPNPTTGIVNVELTPGTCPLKPEIHVFDIYGRRLEVIPVTDETTQIDLSRFATGVYVIKVVNDGNVIAVGKVVKE